MILGNHELIRTSDVSRFAWAELRRFHNVKYVFELHSKLHDIPAKYKKFAEKQAEQIRFCLIQAREYAEAARSVSLATKPLLMYYSCMSLALAEVLLKQTGDSSLDVARKQHNHHGLVLGIDESNFKSYENLFEATSLLKATPMMRGNKERAGTFELWHRSARSIPLLAESTMLYRNFNSTTHHRLLLYPDDNRLPLLAEKGVTLADALANMPAMFGTLRSYGVAPKLARAGLFEEWQHDRSDGVFRIIIQPNDRELYDAVMNAIIFRLPVVERFSVEEVGGGAKIEIKAIPTPFDYMRLPEGMLMSKEEIFFWPKDVFANEFGFIYVALYILGNFARYYPDLWMRAVEQSAPIALVAEKFLEIAEERMPLLSLSEISRSLYVLER